MGRTAHTSSGENSAGIRTLGSMIDRIPQVPTLGDDHRRDVSEAVGSLHSFVDLVERVRSLRVLRLVALAVLNIADWATTLWFLHLGGAEANPALAPIVHRWWAPLAIKAGVFCVVVGAVWRSHVRNRNADRLLFMAVLYYCAVVAWNLWIIAQL
jgi:hypothetical protein